MQNDHQTGLTIIELLMVIGIFAILATFSLWFSIDFFKTYATNSEEITLVTALSKARAQSVSNINRMEHGVRVAGSSYTIFEGPSPLTWANRVQSSDQVLTVNSSVQPTNSTDIVFAQLTGVPTCTAGCSVTMSGAGSTKTITVNSQGAILW